MIDCGLIFRNEKTPYVALPFSMLKNKDSLRLAFHKEGETKKGCRTPLRDNIVSYVARKERSMNRVTIFSHMLQNNELL